MNFMSDQLGFILKVLLLSLGFSIVIKYGGQLVAIAPTNLNAILGITILPLLIAIGLILRLNLKDQSNVK
ncbi:conserved hypothetical protein [Rippkaea orientalis PCC 8801]|uniref:Uncharacterized protein n=2 Tax=Rippkaea TaxID=2546365 RepID=B7JZC5_RIPO1|nr:conserved hypothetical protein [Rippkaea orientalis PCC 8801]